MNDNLTYSIRKKSGMTILDLCGKIIGSRAFTLKEELFRLKDSGVSSVVLNFQEVTSIDSLGVMAITSASEAGLTLKIIYLNTSCRQIIEQSRAANLIPIFSTEEEAIGDMLISKTISKEMRRYKRISTNIPVEIIINDCSQRGVLLNVSEGGVLVGYLDPLSVEPYNLRHINIMMKLPFLGSIELEGRPVRFGRTSEMNIVGVELFSTEKSQKLIRQVKENNLTSNNSSYSCE